jgi:hypothetical protein
MPAAAAKDFAAIRRLERGGIQASRAGDACPDRPGNRHPAALDELPGRPTLPLYTVLHTGPDHRPADGFAAVRNDVGDGPLDTGPDRRPCVLPAGRDVVVALAAHMLKFRPHAGVDDRPADGLAALLGCAGAGVPRMGGLRQRGKRQHAQNAPRQSCTLPHLSAFPRPQGSYTAPRTAGARRRTRTCLKRPCSLARPPSPSSPAATPRRGRVACRPPGA